MKEFKFACPVCGQHITAVAGTSGTQIQCPTCFQKIIVPQERTDDSKLILNAAKADRPRVPLATVEAGQAATAPQKFNPSWLIIIVLVSAGLAVGAYYFHKTSRSQHQIAAATNTVPSPQQISPVTNAVPKSLWTLEMPKATLSKEPVTGSLNGRPFTLTRAFLQGGNFILRQGQGNPPELSLTVFFPAKRGDELAGKTVLVESAQPPPVPRVVMRWKNEKGKTSSRNFTGGYLLKLEFGAEENAKIPGSLFLALPDEEKSYLVGSFVAEVRAPPPPKPKAPKKAPLKPLPKSP